MHIDNINLNNLRIFECVYRTKCMTSASKELHLTQSGVSQHIKALEQSLDVKLFDRINKKIMPTQEGDQLFKHARMALDEIEEVISRITRKEQVYKGSVNIGLPIEFGNNRIVPLLSSLGKEYKEIHFNLTMDFASKFNEMLINGQLDFAFVDEFSMDRRIQIEKVAEEVFELCALKSYLKPFGSTKSNKSYFEQLEYVAYQHEEPILRKWFAHHLKRKNLTLNVKARVMDVQAIARFILGGLGAGVLPDHLVSRLEKQGYELHVFRGSGKPLTNRISLAYLKKRTHKRVVDLVLENLRSKL